MAIDTLNEFRAIQRYSAPLVGISPEPDGTFNASAEFAAFAGVYPIAGGFPTGSTLVPAAQNTIWRAIQFLSDGHISLRLPHPDGAFDERAEMAVVAGTYPFIYTTPAPAAAILHRPLIARAGDPVGAYSTLILGVNREKLH